MNNVVRMDIRNRAYDLLEILSRLFFREILILLYFVEQIVARKVFHDYVDIFLILIVFKYFYNVRMVNVFENVYFID